MPLARALALVRQPLGNPESRFLALDHQLHAFGPPWNHLVEPETCSASPRMTELSNSLPSVVQPE